VAVVALDGLPGPVGAMVAVIDHEHLVALRFAGAVATVGATPAPVGSSDGVGPTEAERAVAARVASDLIGWFGGERTSLSVPVALAPTSVFRQRVYEELGKVPAGQTITYGALAIRAGAPGASRAVGSAMAANPLPFFVPCHRVVPSAGGTGNYGGGSDLKTWLLTREANRCA
jgi:methylated-DNA-[protein]-cysteine S-methyltransferase